MSPRPMSRAAGACCEKAMTCEFVGRQVLGNQHGGGNTQKQSVMNVWIQDLQSAVHDAVNDNVRHNEVALADARYARGHSGTYIHSPLGVLGPCQVSHLVSLFARLVTV